MVVSPTRCEMVTHITIGRLRYWSTIVLTRQGTRWICTFADFG